ncbi:YggT family protein [Propionibacteriaceae bacterium Y1685]|uniref:YggT family protein n=1 Tax=Microlunatus sp. Y1700 TaxID=3418487 RepID=UPI003B7BF550
MQLVGVVIGLVLQVYFWVLVARMVLSWVPVLVQGWEPKGPFLVLAEVVYSLTDPPLRFLRRFLPPVQVGTIAFDLAFLALMILLSVAMWANRIIFFT